MPTDVPIDWTKILDHLADVASMRCRIDDPMDVSRMDSGKIQLVSRSTDLWRLAQEIADGLAGTAHEQDLEIFCHVDPEVPRFVLTDDGRLRQVLVNLLGNAIKFTTTGELGLRLGCIDMGPKDCRVRFEVQDTGIGVPEAQQERIFESFTQVDASSTRQFGGTGLGLAVSHQLVGLLGGELKARSEVGAGSTFYFSLPLKRDLEVVDARQGGAVELSLPRFAGKRLLLVEDNRLNQHFVSLLLQKFGVEVVLAENGAEAVSAAGKGGFDLVLMDVQMPVMDGLEATRKIRAKPETAQHPPIIALTADAQQVTRDSCRAIGMNGFLTKPLAVEALAETLTRFLGDDD